MLLMLKGGIKDSTEHEYSKKFKEYWRTMRRLGFSDEEVWTLPQDAFMLQVYNVDCCMIREKPNCYKTMRGKLSAGDHIARWCGFEQRYADRPDLHAHVAYVKANCRGQGSDTIAVTIERLRLIISFTQRFKLGREEFQINRAMIMCEELDTKKEWQELMVILVIAVTTALRGGEQCRNEEAHYLGYGIKMNKLKWWWKDGKSGRRFAMNAMTSMTDNLIAVQLDLSHTKTKKIGDDTTIMMGRNEGDIKPLLMSYEFWKMRKLENAAFLFFLSIQRTKKLWKQVITEMRWVDEKKWRFHGLCKGFASSLQQRKVEPGLIAFAGRWKLMRSMYRDIIYTSESMEIIASILWGTIPTSIEVMDLDAGELDTVRNMSKEVKNYIKGRKTM